MRSFLRFCIWSLVVLLVAITVVNNTVAKLPSMPQADGKYISLRGKEIHYAEQPGQGVPVVMIHGLPGTHKDFDPVIPELPGAARDLDRSARVRLVQRWLAAAIRTRSTWSMKC